MAILVVVLGVGILHQLFLSLLLNHHNRNVPSWSRIFPFLIYGQPLLIHGESAAIGTDEVSDAMCKEMFDAWINELTASSLSRLQGDGSDASEQTS